MTSPRADFLEIHLHEATAAELERCRQTWRALRAAAEQAPPPRPFLIITPLGMPFRTRITEWLIARHIPILTQTLIPNWAHASTALYAKTDDDERLRVALGYEILWKSIALSLEAERWELPGLTDLQRLARIKEDLRAELGTLRFRVRIPRVTLRSPNQTVRLQAIHVPEPENTAQEGRLLETSLTLIGAQP